METGTNRGLTFGVGFGYAAQTMAEETAPEVYQLHVWIRQISPMIWRRLLVRSDSTLADLHDIIQIAFGWTDSHLHRFRIHGRDYGVSRVGGPWFSQDAHRSGSPTSSSASTSGSSTSTTSATRGSTRSGSNADLTAEPKRTYPVCVGGQRAAPPEDCGGPWAFLERRDAVPGHVREHLERLVESVEAGDLDGLRDELEAIESLREWLTLDRFDRRAVNRRLRLYAAGDERWRGAVTVSPDQLGPPRART